MDSCGKAINLLASTSPMKINKSTSKLIMDNVSLSATACAHAISMLDKPSDRYILPNNDVKGLLTQDDIELRALRGMALRAFSMDEFAPDSVGSILKATSYETIDMLARLGYYDHAISLAKGLTNTRKSCPRGVNLFDASMKHILTTYLVPAATRTSHRGAVSGTNEVIQSRSKIAQIRLASSACTVSNPSSQEVAPISSTNSKCFMSNKHCDEAVQADQAMNLLRQYTTVYSQSCTGLALHVARSIFVFSDGVYDLPQWLKELCIFGDTSDGEMRNGLFATGKGGQQIADPAGLVRLFMKYHRYDEACGVIISVLSKRNSQMSSAAVAPSSRLPEKGNIDFVPYDLIDALYQTINNTVATVTSSDPKVQNKLIDLKSLQKRMEVTLVKHFQLLKLSEDGLKSARALAV
jgi:hypothetical protein